MIGSYGPRCRSHGLLCGDSNSASMCSNHLQLRPSRPPSLQAIVLQHEGLTLVTERPLP